MIFSTSFQLVHINNPNFPVSVQEEIECFLVKEEVSLCSTAAVVSMA